MTWFASGLSESQKATHASPLEIASAGFARVWISGRTASGAPSAAARVPTVAQPVAAIAAEAVSALAVVRASNARRVRTGALSFDGSIGRLLCSGHASTRRRDAG